MSNEPHRISELSQVPALRARFCGACEAAAMEEEELDQWKLVFTELLNNSLEHGCKRPGDEVAVTWAILEERIEVVVDDPGDCLLSEQDFADSDAGDFFDTGRGAGLFLIRTFADEVRVDPRPGGGTTVRVTKRRGDPGAGEELE